MLNYDSAARLQIPERIMETARQLGRQPVHGICDEPGTKADEPGGAATCVLSAFLPRVGDVLNLDDASVCTVTKVVFKTVTFADDGGHARYATLAPFVHGTREPG